MMKDTQMREKALIIVGVILVVIGLITGTFTTSQSIFLVCSKQPLLRMDNTCSP